MLCHRRPLPRSRRLQAATKRRQVLLSHQVQLLDDALREPTLDRRAQTQDPPRPLQPAPSRGAAGRGPWHKRRPAFVVPGASVLRNQRNMTSASRVTGCTQSATRVSFITSFDNY